MTKRLAELVKIQKAFRTRKIPEPLASIRRKRQRDKSDDFPRCGGYML